MNGKKQIQTNRDQKAEFLSPRIVYEYTVNGQRYEYHTRIGSSIDQYPIGKEYPGYYNPKNPADVTETLNDITGGDNRFFSLLFFGIGVLAIIFALIRISAVITIL